MGENKKAIECYDKAIQVDPKCSKAYNNKGVASSYLKDNKGTIDNFNKAI